MSLMVAEIRGELEDFKAKFEELRIIYAAFRRVR